MKKLKVMVVLAAAILMIGSTAWADSYISGQVGLFMPEEDDVLDDGYNIEIAYGKSLVDMFPGLATAHPAWEKVTAELGIGYRHADGGTTLTSFGSTITTKVDLDVIPVTLAAVYTQEIAGTPLKFYGGAGLGVFFASTEAEATTTVPFLGTITVSDDDSDIEFGGVIKGGILYSLNERLDFSGGAQLDLVSDDIGGLCINIGMRYHF